VRAGLTVFSARPESVLEVRFAPELGPELRGMLGAASERGIPCREASGAELERIAGTPHHEGLLLVARPRPWLRLADLVERLASARGVALALDRVRNPYNIGPILRAAAFFGVRAVVLGSPAPHRGVPAEAVRIAEGGAEHLAFARTTDLAVTLARFRGQGIHVYGGDPHADTSLFDFPFVRPAVVVVGHEREGLLPRVRSECDALLAVPGSGAIESLNVSIAASLLLAEIARGRPPETA
jgi:tRNA G18 (ribose-2'-O)-methylase SpoU